MSVSYTHLKIIIFCLAVLIPFSYGIPFISLLKAWKQQYKIGVYWKDRTDYHLPEWQREWYLTYDRGGFIPVSYTHLPLMEAMISEWPLVN